MKVLSVIALSILLSGCVNFKHTNVKVNSTSTVYMLWPANGNIMYYKFSKMTRLEFEYLAVADKKNLVCDVEGKQKLFSSEIYTIDKMSCNER